MKDDGLEFHADTVQAERMKDDDEYQGLRLKLHSNLASARISIQIDIGFGDAVTPEADEITCPTLLDLPAPTLKAYPRETVVAEKYQAMVVLGIANSRMKDFTTSGRSRGSSSSAARCSARQSERHLRDERPPYRNNRRWLSLLSSPRTARSSPNGERSSARAGSQPRDWNFLKSLRSCAAS